jgi:pyruvate/2-oxoglutarate dehydrogenase complex dihydrolipoamide dehydrogenase (E3) component
MGEARMDGADIVILGAGAGAKLIWGSVPGRSVTVIERELVGGYCPFYACVPSKAMLRSAAVWELGDGEQFRGLCTDRADAADAYRQAVARRERIVNGRDDSRTAAALEKTGARLLRGTGRIVRPGVVEVDGSPVEYRDLVLNTGSAPRIPDLPGLDEVPVWTSEQAMSTSEQPGSMVVLGGGPVGCELAYLFAVLGTRVTLVQRNTRLIPREEPEASASMAERLEAVGVRVLLGAKVTAAQAGGAGARLTLAGDDPVEAERVLVATGRLPRSSGLGLDALGLRLAPGQPVQVDQHCRVTGTGNVWAVGDVNGVSPFTHTAHYQGRVVAANLAGRPVRADYRGVPRAVYTTPVLAAVGHTEASARAAGIDPVVVTTPVSSVVRSSTEGSADGWLKLLADPGRGTLIGATAMGGYAEEWISEVSLAVRAEVPVAAHADVVHPFPTYSEILEGPLWTLAAQLSA